jgi:tetratricopeptide (TPR) repeat protein
MSVTSLVVAAVTMAAGQATPSRDEAIWSYVQARMDQQIDVWFDDGEFPKAIQALRFENGIFPHDYEVATNLGWMQENVEDYASATTTYERYLRQNPKDVDAPLPLAQLYFRQKQYAKVPPLLTSAIKRTPPPHGNVWRILAHSYDRLNELEKSRDVWKAYIKAVPGDEAAKANLRRVEDKIKSSGN